MLRNYDRRTVWFVLCWLLSLVPFWSSISTLAALSMQDDRYSYAILMPLLCIGLFSLHKKSIFAESQYCLGWGIPLSLAGSIFYCAARRGQYGLTAEMAAVIVVWISGYVAVFGFRSLRAAYAPLVALALAVPLPIEVMHKAEVGLQYASADASHVVFQMIGIPVFRNGLVFSLPGLNIEVAEQCSGIRSTTALLITVALASHLFFRSSWSKLCLILLTIPIAIIKNAVRITTLSWLDVYVSHGVLAGPLHRLGGLPFTLVAVAILVPLFFLVRWIETRASELWRASSSTPPEPARRTGS